MVIAVDPSNPANVALGGTYDTPDAALFIGAVTGPPIGPLTYTVAGAHRGRGVHVDILAIRFTNDGSQVWVACDGGVFVSTTSGQEGTFVARTTGLPVVAVSVQLSAAILVELSAAVPVELAVAVPVETIWASRRAATAAASPSTRS
jgi:hypothetical protein